jgi:hypothetical protein
MVKGQTTKIMTKALTRFAKNHNTTVDKVCIFIRLKENEEEPSYCKTVNGKWVLDETNKTKELKFNRDILDLKFDLLGREQLTAHFMCGYFAKVSEKENIPSKEIYLMISSVDDKMSDLKLLLFQNSIENKTFKAIKKITLDDVFGED